MLRHRLHFGPYRTPKVRIGQRVEDEWRGTVKVVAISDGKIQWPIGCGPGGGLSPVLFRGLARAVRRESAAAVTHWFGVRSNTIWRWRLTLGVKEKEGDVRLRVAIGKRTSEPLPRCVPRRKNKCELVN